MSTATSPTTTTTSVPTRTLDVDSHEMVPLHMWEETFGPETALLAATTQSYLSTLGDNSSVRPDLTGDDVQISEAEIWNLKGPSAPGAIDIRRRAEVLRAMGIDRQLIFPTMALAALMMLTDRDVHNRYRFDPNEYDARQIGRDSIDAYNRWVVNTTRELGDAGVLPVGVVVTQSLETMMADAEQLLAGGAKGLYIVSGTPPADTSPADKALDPFWKLAADADVPVVAHISTEGAFSSPQWYANVPEFVQGPKSSLEFAVEPFRASTINLTHEAFLTAMLLGGVFERHPNLRFGVIECGAQWVGPLAERLDMWAEKFASRLSALSMKPSHYLVRQVRITPFVFEPVARYFERWPDLIDIYTYSTDYPHVEGGRDSKRKFFDEIAQFGDDVVDRFFYKNATTLIPA